MVKGSPRSRPPCLRERLGSILSGFLIISNDYISEGNSLFSPWQLSSALPWQPCKARQKCVMKKTRLRNEFFVILIPIIQFKSRQFSPTKILNKNITVQYMQIRRSVKILSKQATVVFLCLFLHLCRSGRLKSSKTAETTHS